MIMIMIIINYGYNELNNDNKYINKYTTTYNKNDECDSNKIIIIVIIIRILFPC